MKLSFVLRNVLMESRPGPSAHLTGMKSSSMTSGQSPGRSLSKTMARTTRTPDSTATRKVQDAPSRRHHWYRRRPRSRKPPPAVTTTIAINCHRDHARPYWELTSTLQAHAAAPFSTTTASSTVLVHNKNHTSHNKLRRDDQRKRQTPRPSWSRHHRGSWRSKEPKLNKPRCFLSKILSHGCHLSEKIFLIAYLGHNFDYLIILSKLTFDTEI